MNKLPSKKLIIEIDGGHYLQQQSYDMKRTMGLHEQSFEVIRFWNHDISQNIETVLDSILSICDRKKMNELFILYPSSCPSPARGEGTIFFTQAYY